MKLDKVVSVLFFGSIWGVAEATLGGALHIVRVPFGGAIMASFGFAMLYAAARSGLGPVCLGLIGIFAASFKFLDPILFGISPFADIVVNPAVAIAAQSLAFVLVFRGKSAGSGFFAPAPRLLAATAIYMVVFSLISVGVFGWATNYTKDPMMSALVQLPLTALLATALSYSFILASKRLTAFAGLSHRALATAMCIILAVVARIWL